MGRSSQAQEKLLKAALNCIWRQSYGATSVDQICESAGVNKGSFYYFFKSKSALAASALEANWDAQRPNLESIFFPTNPPIQRLVRFFDQVAEHQIRLYQESGSILGCPVFTLGCEICTGDPELQSTIQSILDRYRRLMTSAITDAIREGELPPGDPDILSARLFAWFEGSLMTSRIHNSPQMLESLTQNALQILGYPPPTPTQKKSLE
jgi:TetR/AcrR family transcriptional regulator, transcriptional repressor for nem operon